MSRLTIMPSPAEVAAQWERLEPLFRRSIESVSEPEFTVGQLKEMAANSTAIIAYIEEGDEVLMAFAMEIIEYPRMTALNVMAMAGCRMKELFTAHREHVAEFGRWMGATHFQASGTPGMARLFKSMGYYSAYEVMRYKI